MSLIFLKEPFKIKWYITNKCNLKCKFCYLKDFSGIERNKEEINIVLEVFRKIKPIKVSLLGGEPTEFKYFIYILEELNKMKIKSSFSTNGQNLHSNKKILESLKNIKNLEEVQISLEGPTKLINDNLRGKGSYENILKTINKLKKLGINVVISMVLNKENFKCLNQMIDKCLELKVKELRIIPFIFDQEDNKNMNLFLKLNEIEKIISNLKKPSNLLVSTYSINKTTNNSVGCGAGIVSVVINQDLTLSACDLLTQKERTKDSIKETEDFFKIWENDKIFDKWRIGENRLLLKENKCPLIERCNNLYENF